jgi:hypothetical protein
MKEGILLLDPESRTKEELHNIFEQIESQNLAKDTDFNKEQRATVKQLLQKHTYIFAPNSKAPLLTPKVKHTI